MTASDEAERAGIDLSLLDENLRMTPEQRADKHQSALDLALALERAGQQRRDRPKPTDTAPV